VQVWDGSAFGPLPGPAADVCTTPGDPRRVQLISLNAVTADGRSTERIEVVKREG
jgi:hypothetical protein